MISCYEVNSRITIFYQTFPRNKKLTDSINDYFFFPFYLCSSCFGYILGLDGSTSAQEREKLINQFNSPDNTKAWLFLLSTR